MPFERLLDELALDTLSRLLERGSSNAFGALGEQLEIVCRDSSVLCHDGCAFHPVLKLTDISRPSMASDRIKCGGSESQVSFIALHRELLQELSREQFDILAALPKRRQFDYDDSEPKIQIFAELPFCHGIFQVSIRCGDNTCVNLDLLSPADPLKPLVLKKAQELDLYLTPQFTNPLPTQCT